MKRLLLSVLSGLVLAPLAGWGTDQFYINYGTVTVPPVIDAINFVNYGTFDISTTLPFETSNTRNYTNYGTLTGSVGWQFDTAPSGSGVRKMAGSFYNDNIGVVQAAGAPSYLLVSATNIINKGLLNASADGILQLTGTNVNLYRSGLEISSVASLASGSCNNCPGTNQFEPDVAITDYYWASNIMTMNSTIIWDGVNAQTPRHRVQTAGGGGGTVQLSIYGPVAGSYTNIVSGVVVTATNSDGYSTTNVFVPTNVVRQAVFTVGAYNVSAQVRFYPSPDPLPLQTVSVELATVLTNVVTGDLERDAIYLVDTLASDTNNVGLYTNFNTLSTFRPGNYLVTRLEPTEFANGNGGSGTPAPDFFYGVGFTNPMVTAEYSAYSAFIDSVVSRPPPVPGGTVTNIPGSIRISAATLDLSRARFRGEGEIMIQTSHLVGSSNAVFDCENLSYNLGATNGHLNVVNLAKDSVDRLGGYIYAWSGLWTNYMLIVTTNYTLDTNATPPIVLTPLTNVAQFTFHALILDGSSLQTQFPVTVYDMVAHSTNIVISDAMTVVQSFLLDGQSFTLLGSITLSDLVQNWTSATAPNLQYFTNNGTLTIPNEAHFGDDTAKPYATFVNTGTISANSETVRSGYFENDGLLNSGSRFYVTTPSGKMQNGQVTASGVVQFLANVFKFDQSIVQAGDRLDLSVTNSLFDSGGGAGNTFSCGNGFRLLVKPQTGDLLGTTLQTKAPLNAEVDHVWAGVDRGPSTAGFSNNVAIGKLALTPGPNENTFPPLFFFTGTGVGNAIYVDYLDLSHLSDYANEIAIDQNLVIYFAAAKLGFTPPPNAYGIAQEPEEYLDGQFGGHLRWVSSFAGPNSSVAVLINGQTVMVNKALRNSKIIDSDGDGLPNYYDATPFGGLSLTASLMQTNPPPSKVLAISWQAAPNTVYQVEFSTNMPPANWQQLLKYTNNVSTNRVVTICDTNAPVGAPRRLYRVGFSP